MLPRSELAEMTRLARAMIARVPGFRDCPGALLDEFVARGRFREFKSKECAFRVAEPATQMGFLIRGNLESIRIRKNGQRQLIGLLLPGDIVGLIPCMDGMGTINDIYARSRATVLMLQQSDFDALRQLDGGLDRAIATYLAFRCRLLYERLAQNQGIPLELRLASLLQLMGSLYGIPKGQGCILDVKITQMDLADWLGVSRQSINLAIGVLEAKGLLGLAYSTIHILDRERLNKLVAEEN